MADNVQCITSSADIPTGHCQIKENPPGRGGDKPSKHRQSPTKSAQKTSSDNHANINHYEVSSLLSTIGITLPSLTNSMLSTLSIVCPDEKIYTQTSSL